jgi:hypothetical protein
VATASGGSSSSSSSGGWQKLQHTRELLDVVRAATVFGTGFGLAKRFMQCERWTVQRSKFVQRH